MKTAAAEHRYTATAATLHALMAVLIVGTFALGLYMTSLSFSPTRLKLYNYHKWVGITILGLAAVRLLWRLTHRPPADLPMPRWQQRSAHVAHAALYVLFFALPLAGWAYSSAAGFPIVWLGIWPLPDFVAPDRELAAVLKDTHRWLAYALSGVVLLHVAGALKHHFIDRDRLLHRMRLGRD